MAWLPLLTSWLALLLGVALRYHRVDLRYATPLPLSATAWAVLGVLSLSAFTILILRRGRWLLRSRAARLAALETLILPLLFLAVWIWFPSGRRQPVHLAFAAAAIGAIAFLLRRDPGWPAVWGSARTFRAAWRSLGPATLVLAAPALALFLLHPQPIPGRRILWSLLGYPVYAFVQLLFVLVFPVSRLRTLQASPVCMVLVPAGLFALVHWPNPTLMPATFVAMLVWAWVYRRHPSLPAVALSMALLATVTTQLLPERLTAHLRAGPGYVFHAHLDELFAEEARLEQRCVSDSFYRDAGGDVPSYARALFEVILQGRASAEELQRFSRKWDLELHARVAADFERSRRRRDGLPPDETACVLRGREIAARWFEDRRRTDAGGYAERWNGYIAMLYPTVLGREGSPAEIASWNSLPDVGFRRAMIHAAFEEPAFHQRPLSAAHRLRLLTPLLPPHEEPSASPRETSIRDRVPRRTPDAG